MAPPTIAQLRRDKRRCVLFSAMSCMIVVMCLFVERLSWNRGWWLGVAANTLSIAVNLDSIHGNIKLWLLVDKLQRRLTT